MSLIVLKNWEDWYAFLTPRHNAVLCTLIESTVHYLTLSTRIRSNVIDQNVKKASSGMDGQARMWWSIGSVGRKIIK